MVTFTIAERDVILDALCQYRNDLLERGNKSRAGLCLEIYNYFMTFY
jgi:hypothetical protein